MLGAFRSIIVSAADKQYFSLVCDLTASIRRLGFKANFDIGILDVGLDDSDRKSLELQGITITKAGSDIDYSMRAVWEKTKPGVRALTGRPFLREYFPGYDVYMWLDADVWVQTPDAIDTMLAAASAISGICIVPELDRCYARFFQHAGVWHVYRDWYRANFGSDIANAMVLKPGLNTGVIAIAKDSAVWDKWKDVYTQALRAQTADLSATSFMIEQQSMNIALYLGGAPYIRMPANYNWLTCYALPKLDCATGLYVEPLPPHAPISQIHLTQPVKSQVEKIECVDGGIVERSLTYSAAKHASD